MHTICKLLLALNMPFQISLTTHDLPSDGIFMIITIIAIAIITNIIIGIITNMIILIINVASVSQCDAR